MRIVTGAVVLMGAAGWCWAVGKALLLIPPLRRRLVMEWTWPTPGKEPVTNQLALVMGFFFSSAVLAIIATCYGLGGVILGR